MQILAVSEEETHRLVRGGWTRGAARACGVRWAVYIPAAHHAGLIDGIEPYASGRRKLSKVSAPCISSV